MSAARASSKSGNGNHRWLKELIAKIEQLTLRLQDLVSDIRSLPDPTAANVAQARDLVMQLVSVIEKQIRPRQWEIAELASASGPVHGFNAALDSLSQSGQDALSAIDVYKKTLDREHQLQSSERRSNTRYSADQKALQRLRREAAVTVSNLTAASEGFVHFMSS